MKKSSVDKQLLIESKYVKKRLFELLESPVQGSFDAIHLQKIHQRIFQDLPANGCTHVKPGKFRKQVPANKVWYKERNIKGLKSSYDVVYSLMDAKAVQQIDKVLLDANPAELSKLSVPEFAQKMADIYANLDYLHPFDDGNSRTLRVFTNQLADEAGFELAWENFNNNENGKNILYIARDIAVNKIIVNTHSNDAVKRDAQLILNMLTEYKSLQQLLPAVIKSKHQIKLEDAVKNASLALDDFKKQQSSDINLYEKLANQASAARYELDMFIENGYKPPAIDNPKQSATKSRGR